MSTGAADLLHEADDPLVAVGDPSGKKGGDIVARSPMQLFLRRFLRDKVAIAAGCFIILLVFIAIAAPLLIKLFGVPKPDVQNSKLIDDFGLPSGPSAEHPFGVDKVGRDVLSRVLYGARTSLIVAVVGTGLSVMIGVTMGMLAGFFKGWVDMLISRLIDILLAFPVLLLGLGLATACSDKEGCLGGLLQPGLTVVVAIIIMANWPYVARIIRGQVLSIREKEFIEASRSLGASNARIAFREILPNLIAPIIVYATLFIPANILLEAALSFLGVGIQPPDPSWGQMLADATDIFDTAPWYMFYPGGFLLLTVLAFNLVGDGLQDALNPRGTK